MTPRKFLTRLVVRGIILTTILLLVAFIVPPASTVITNDIALGQMQNSDAAYITMEAYNRMKPIGNCVRFLSIIWFMGATFRDIRTYAKN